MYPDGDVNENNLKLFVFILIIELTYKVTIANKTVQLFFNCRCVI